jgi:hypothetical protein
MRIRANASTDFDSRWAPGSFMLSIGYSYLISTLVLLHDLSIDHIHNALWGRPKTANEHACTHDRETRRILSLFFKNQHKNGSISMHNVCQASELQYFVTKVEYRNGGVDV